MRALYSAGSFIGNDGATWQFSVPNEAHGRKCDEHRADVEAALSAAVGSPVTIVIGEGAVDDPDHPAPTPAPRHRRPPPRRHRPGRRRPERVTTTRDDRRADAPRGCDRRRPIDPDELTDAPPEAVLTPIDRLAEAFPGSELVADDGH